MEDKTREKARGVVVAQLQKIATGRVNDAVKLAYLDMEEGNFGELDRLDLTNLTEFKRSPGGTVEVKLVNRVAVLERMLEVLGGDDDRAEAFLKALEGAGGKNLARRTEKAKGREDDAV
ncbi:MAG: XRE family transcriptional regulator [Oscillospiraceae bacterium]